jgi:acetoin utilization deacetylase AcuC-like enzyme
MTSAKRLGLITHSDCLLHVPPGEHAERPDRLRSAWARLESSGLSGEAEVLDAEEVDLEAVRRVHTVDYVDALERSCAAGASQLEVDTYSAGAASWRAARLAAGAAVEATARVLDGRWKRAFCAVRPPGHHAEADRPMGFCLFNSIAVAANEARRAGLDRVAVVDFDVHHGNGTQHLFEEDPSVFFASIHQMPLYPGTGAAAERGVGAGEGATLNLPQEPGAGSTEWLRAFDEQLLPALEAFAPELILVSAGFDGHAADPLAQTELASETYAAFTRRLAEQAERSAGGRMVALLEGGYDLTALADSVEQCVGALREG